MICKFYDNVVFVCTNLNTSVFFFNINFKGGNLTSFAARIQEKKHFEFSIRIFPAESLYFNA